MEEELVKKEENETTNIKWTSMLALSAGFHIAIFLLIMVIPDTISAGRNFEDRVYQVDLVELPAGAAASSPEIIGPTVKKASSSSVSDNTQTKRIFVPKTEKKPLVIAKRTIKPKIKKKKEPEISPSQLIDQEISKIEKKVASEKDNQPEDNFLAESLARLKERVGLKTKTPSPGGGSIEGLPMRMYQMEVEVWIKNNWSYPVADRGQKKLEATVLLTVKEDGTIVKSSFKKRSSDTFFDQQVEKAIKKSNPLPRFPEGYRKSEEEFEINFNLKDLEDS